MRDNLSELPILLCCLWAGTLLGVIYELLRLLRLSGKGFATAAADAAFGICFFAVTSAVLLYADSGRIRIHYFAAIFAAMLLWINYPAKLIREALLCVKSRLFCKKTERGNTKKSKKRA